jgi:hypothetical protein
VVSLFFAVTSAIISDQEKDEFRDCMIGFIQARNISLDGVDLVSYDESCDGKLERFMQELTELSHKNGKVSAECSYKTIEQLEAKPFLFQFFIINFEKNITNQEKAEKLRKTPVSLINRLVQHFIYFSCKEFDSVLSATDNTYNETEMFCIRKFVADNKFLDANFTLNSTNDEIDIESFDCDTFVDNTRREMELTFDKDLFTDEQRECIGKANREEKFFDTVARLFVLGQLELSTEEKAKERKYFDDFYPKIFHNVVTCLKVS